MADLLVLTGPPGAGKSTVAALVVETLDPGVLVPGDLFFSLWRRGAIPPWLPEAHTQNGVAIRAAAAAAAAYAAGGYPVVYDGVVGPWFLPVFAEAAERQGLSPPTDLHYVVLMPSLERCRARVAGRRDHGFTDDDATAQMHGEFATELVTGRLAGRHVLPDPPDTPAAAAALVLDRWTAGDLRLGEPR